jgi:hypothetical protein
LRKELAGRKGGVEYEYLFGRKINLQGSSEPLLFRAMKAGRLKQLPSEILANGTHLFNLKEKFKSKLKVDDDSDDDSDEAEDHAKMELEEHRVVANVIGMAGVISVNFSKGLTTFAIITTDPTWQNIQFAYRLSTST